MENFKKIKDYPNYEVSNLGRVRRLYKKGYKYRKLPIQRGYQSVTFSIGTQWKKHAVHRLVADAFIPNPENKPCVNHINGIKSDNRVDNLEWCTFSENEKHSFKVLGKVTNGIINRKIDLKEIKEIKQMKINGISQKDIAIKYGVSNGVISLIINNKTYTKHV